MTDNGKWNLTTLRDCHQIEEPSEDKTRSIGKENETATGMSRRREAEEELSFPTQTLFTSKFLFCSLYLHSPSSFPNLYSLISFFGVVLLCFRSSAGASLLFLSSSSRSLPSPPYRALHSNERNPCLFMGRRRLQSFEGIKSTAPATDQTACDLLTTHGALLNFNRPHSFQFHRNPAFVKLSVNPLKAVFYDNTVLSQKHRVLSGEMARIDKITLHSSI